jgi:hypothetical protein
MNAQKCKVCTKDTFLQFYSMTLAGKRFKFVEIWACSNECASEFFGEKVEA